MEGTFLNKEPTSKDDSEKLENAINIAKMKESYILYFSISELFGVISGLMIFVMIFGGIGTLLISTSNIFKFELWSLSIMFVSYIAYTYSNKKKMFYSTLYKELTGKPIS